MLLQANALTLRSQSLQLPLLVILKRRQLRLLYHPQLLLHLVHLNLRLDLNVLPLRELLHELRQRLLHLLLLLRDSLPINLQLVQLVYHVLLLDPKRIVLKVLLPLMLALEEVLQVIQRHLVDQVLLVSILSQGWLGARTGVLPFILEVLARFYVLAEVVEFQIVVGWVGLVGHAVAAELKEGSLQGFDALVFRALAELKINTKSSIDKERPFLLHLLS